MTGIPLFVALLLLVPAGIFGMCLPVVRELGRPTRLACAALCGAVVLSIEAAIFALAQIPLSLPLLFGPLVAASAAGGWFLCRLPESPGPESAYPGIPCLLVVLVSTVFLQGAFAAGGPALTSGSIFVGMPAVAVSTAAGGTARFLPIFWLLAGLPLVAALLSIHVNQRRGWMIAASWYAVVSLTLSLRHPGDAVEVARIVFATLGALAVFSCAKEPRLLPLASIMLCGVALTGNDSLVIVAAIVAGGVARDVREGLIPAAKRAAIVLIGPAAAIAFGSDGLLARLGADRLPTIADAFTGTISTGIFGLTWALPLLVLAAMLPGKQRRIASLLPILAPCAVLVIVLVLDALELRGQANWNAAATAPFVASEALALLVITSGLALRERSPHHARQPHRTAPAR
ncbi:MAG: hypothetical protein WC538_01320 [Thermoanaerobaculia bacterium]|jgi:hypothetical protein